MYILGYLYHHYYVTNKRQFLYASSVEQSLRTLSYSGKKQELDKIFSSKNSKYGVDLLLELKLDEDLEIYNLDRINLNNDIIGIWASLTIGNRYEQEFTRSEKEIINDVKERHDYAVPILYSIQQILQFVKILNI